MDSPILSNPIKSTMSMAFVVNDNDASSQLKYPQNLPTPDLTPKEGALEYPSKDVTPTPLFSEPSAVEPVHESRPSHWASVSVTPTQSASSHRHPEAVVRSHAWSTAAVNTPQYLRDMAHWNTLSYGQKGAEGMTMLCDVVIARAALDAAKDSMLQFHAERRESHRAKKPNSRAQKTSRDSGITRKHPKTPEGDLKRCVDETEELAPFSSSFSKQSSASRKRRPSTKGEDGSTPPKRQRSEAQKKQKYDSYMDIQDCIPAKAVQDLPSNFNYDIKDKKTAPMDMSKEPSELVQLLTPQELKLAASLRLSCNAFLINKRLLFRGKVFSFFDKQSMKPAKNQNFTKTHAQTACVIDVNKASKLWEFYNEAGMLQSEHFSKLVEQEFARRQLPDWTDIRQ